MEKFWKIAVVEYERADDRPGNLVRLTTVEWECMQPFNNPDYPADDPTMPVPEFLYAIVHGTTDITSQDITTNRIAVDQVSQSSIVARVHNILGADGVVDVEILVDNDMRDIIDPPRGRFIPTEDRDGL